MNKMEMEGLVKIYSVRMRDLYGKNWRDVVANRLAGVLVDELVNIVEPALKNKQATHAR